MRLQLVLCDDWHGTPAAPTDELPIEDVLVVEHDVIPVDGADVFQQGGIDSIGERVALAQDPGDLPELLRPRAILCKLSATKSTKILIARRKHAVGWSIVLLRPKSGMIDLGGLP